MSAQMLGIACSEMRPENDEILKLAVLGAMDRHGEMTPVLPDEFRHLRSGRPPAPGEGAATGATIARRSAHAAISQDTIL